MVQAIHGLQGQPEKHQYRPFHKYVLVQSPTESVNV